MARFGFDRRQHEQRDRVAVNGSGRSSAASTTLKTAVFAPMPTATIATATSAELLAFQQRADRVIA